MKSAVNAGYRRLLAVAVWLLLVSPVGSNMLSDGSRTNIWDSQNRLVQTAFNNVTSAFTYGPDGLRRTAASGGATTHYILDGQNVVQEVTSGPSGSETATYFWGPRGPECRIDPQGNTRWFVYDGHGNVVAEAGPPDQYGNPLLGLRSYDPWGGNTTSGSLIAPLAYCGSLGHPTETDSGLLYMRARYYDPVLGRFISEDPARDGINWYAYAGNDPVGKADPSGNFAAFIADVEQLEAEVRDAAAAVGAGQAMVAKIASSVACHGLEILAALQGGGQVAVRAVPGRGVAVYNELGKTVFIHIGTLHKNMGPHFDVQPQQWTALWNALYEAINKLEF